MGSRGWTKRRRLGGFRVSRSRRGKTWVKRFLSPTTTFPSLAHVPRDVAAVHPWFHGRDGCIKDVGFDLASLVVLRRRGDPSDGVPEFGDRRQGRLVKLAFE